MISGKGSGQSQDRVVTPAKLTRHCQPSTRDGSMVPYPEIEPTY